jgi:hypothetical protein
VCCNVVLGCVPRVLGGMKMVSVREMGVVRGLLMVAGLVVSGGFAVVACSVFVVFRCIGVVMGCFVRHGFPPGRLQSGFYPQRELSEA